MAHIIPFFEGGIILLFLEFFLLKPTFLIYIIVALTLFILLGILIPKQRFLNGREFWHYLSTPLIFIWSGVLLLVFFENFYLKHFFVLSVAIYIFFYFENLLHYLISEDEESKGSFLRMTNLMNVVTIFFLSAGFFGIKIFIQMPIWILAIAFFIFGAGLTFNSLSILKIKIKEIFLDIFIISLIITEFFLIVHFLPIGFYAGGAILAISYYMLGGMLINKLKHNHIPYKRYLIVGFILLFLVLSTARWV